MIKKNKITVRNKRKIHIRKKISGTQSCPRLTVFKSAKHFYAQIIDDSAKTTIVASSDLSKSIVEDVKNAKNFTDVAKLVGKDLANKAKEKNIQSVVFDRNGYLYHGNIKSFADSARENGLKF